MTPGVEAATPGAHVRRTRPRRPAARDKTPAARVGMIASVTGRLPIEATARARSRIALVAAGFVVAFAILDVLRGGPSWELALGARAAWIAALVAASRLVLAAGGRATRALTAGSVLLSVGALFVLSVARPADFGSVAFLMAAPLLVGVLLPDARGAVWSSAALSTIAVIGALLARGAPLLDALGYALRAAAAGAIAVLGAAMLARVRTDEIRLAEERALAVDALARSEKRRAEAERLAAAGSSAARVAHDMSNPLASLRVNLDWLQEKAEEGRLEAEADEVREVLRETRECVDRLAVNLADFRAAARSARVARPEAVSDEGGRPAAVSHLGAPGKA
jgi:signal transduction histidine kinase